MIAPETGAASGVNAVLLAQFTGAQTLIERYGGTPSTAANTNGFGVPNQLYLGKGRASGGFTGGRLYAALVIARLLSAGEKAELLAAMAARGGVSL